MYKSDFKVQLAHFDSELKIFKLKPEKAKSDFGVHVNFMAHCFACYPKIMKESKFAERIIELIEEHYTLLNPKLRAKLVQSLVLIRNRGMLEAIPLFRLLLKLFDCEDKQLRVSVFNYIVSDVRNNVLKNSNQKANRETKNFVLKHLEDASTKIAVKTLAVVSDLYRRKVWTDARTVNVIANACFSDVPKVATGAMRFFLGIDQQIDALENDEDSVEREKFLAELPKVKKTQHAKLTRKRKRQMERAVKKVKKHRMKMRDKEAGEETMESKVLLKAIEMIHDPQSFTERLFKRLRGSKCPFETKLMMMDLVSRLIGTHHLILLPFYSYIQRYLNSPTHQSITRILASFLQSCHPVIPADELLPVTRTVADAFVIDRRPADVICIGINTICGIINRVPHILEEKQMQNLVGDLVQFKKNRDKGIVIAARGMINTIRAHYPELLKARDRGRDHVKGAKPLSYGASNVKKGDINVDESFDSSDDNESDDEDKFDPALVNPEALEGWKFKKRQRKEERLATVRAGREQHIKEKRGGSTNSEKLRRKNFNMVQQSAEVRKKLKRSLKQQQTQMKKRIKQMRIDAKCSGKKINRRRK